MSKYFVYCLYKDSDVIYVGSSTNLLLRLKTHKRDKDFNKVIYCELPNREVMLDFEAYCIDRIRPPLNSVTPKPTMTEKPDGIAWKRADLSFLYPDDVDSHYNLAFNIHWNYMSMLCEHFNISNIDPYGEYLTYVKIDGKVVAVFDGSGVSLKQLAVIDGLISLEEFEDIIYEQEGVISMRQYQKSLEQFNSFPKITKFPH